MRQKGFVCLVAIVLSLGMRPASASIGLAEWEVQTPGGNFVTHADPYSAKCGICLMSETQTELGAVSRKNYASQVSWWQYYPDHVAGKAAEGYFLFQEKSQSILFFKTELELRQALVNNNLLNKSLAKPMTPQDGWNETWGPILQNLPK